MRRDGCKLIHRWVDVVQHVVSGEHMIVNSGPMISKRTELGVGSRKRGQRPCIPCS